MMAAGGAVRVGHPFPLLFPPLGGGFLPVVRGNWGCPCSLFLVFGCRLTQITIYHPRVCTRYIETDSPGCCLDVGSSLTGSCGNDFLVFFGVPRLARPLPLLPPGCMLLFQKGQSAGSQLVWATDVPRASTAFINGHASVPGSGVEAPCVWDTTAVDD